MDKFITANGCVIRINEQGEGENTLVLLHGYLETLEVWDEFSELLSPSMKIISLDLPGHGVSQVKGETHSMEFLADTVADALKKLGVNKVILLGHSMGGYVAMEFLNRHSQMLSGLILLHASTNPNTEEKIANRNRQIEIVKSDKKELLTQLIPNRFAKENHKKFAETIEGLKELVDLTEPEGIIAILNGMNQKSDLNTVLSGSSVPQLFIFGRHDNYIDEEAVNQMIAKQPKAKIVWLEHSGHMGFIEEPELTANAVKEFIISLRN